MLAPADMDGDADVDLLAVYRDVFYPLQEHNHYTSTLVWYENDGTGQFEKHPLSANRDGALTGIGASDVDADGDVDLFSLMHVSDTSWTAIWHENTAANGFRDHIVDEHSTEWSVPPEDEVHLIDVDADGDIDVLCTDKERGSLLWYANDGDQPFDKKTIYSQLGVLAQSPFPVDLDGDADVDFLTISWTPLPMNDSSAVRWHENKGDGTFAEHAIGRSTYAPVAVTAGDMDNDQDLDVLATAIVDRDILRTTWYENDGSQGFHEKAFADVAGFDAPWGPHRSTPQYRQQTSMEMETSTCLSSSRLHITGESAGLRTRTTSSSSHIS